MRQTLRTSYYDESALGVQFDVSNRKITRSGKGMVRPLPTNNARVIDRVLYCNRPEDYLDNNTIMVSYSALSLHLKQNSDRTLSTDGAFGDRTELRVQPPSRQHSRNLYDERKFYAERLDRCDYYQPVSAGLRTLAERCRQRPHKTLDARAGTGGDDSSTGEFAMLCSTRRADQAPF